MRVIESRHCFRCVQVDPAIVPPAPIWFQRYAELIVLAQKVPHASGVHVDNETDNIETEVKRLEALGARRIEKIEIGE